jgi:hypothetical protein
MAESLFGNPRSLMSPKSHSATNLETLTCHTGCILVVPHQTELMKNQLWKRDMSSIASFQISFLFRNCICVSTLDQNMASAERRFSSCSDAMHDQFEAFLFIHDSGELIIAAAPSDFTVIVEAVSRQSFTIDLMQ